MVASIATNTTYLFNIIHLFLHCLMVSGIIIIIIIILSHRQHGSPLLSLATLLYRPLLSVDLQGNILYPHRAVVCKF